MAFDMLGVVIELYNYHHNLTCEDLERLYHALKQPSIIPVMPQPFHTLSSREPLIYFLYL